MQSKIGKLIKGLIQRKQSFQYYDADLNKCIALDDFGYWRKVTGYFSGYPLSIEHNR